MRPMIVRHTFVSILTQDRKHINLPLSGRPQNRTLLHTVSAFCHDLVCTMRSIGRLGCRRIGLTLHDSPDLGDSMPRRPDFVLDLQEQSSLFPTGTEREEQQPHYHDPTGQSKTPPTSKVVNGQIRANVFVRPEIAREKRVTWFDIGIMLCVGESRVLLHTMYVYYLWVWRCLCMNRNAA